MTVAISAIAWTDWGDVPIEVIQEVAIQIIQHPGGIYNVDQFPESVRHLVARDAIEHRGLFEHRDGSKSDRAFGVRGVNLLDRIATERDADSYTITEGMTWDDMLAVIFTAIFCPLNET